MPHNEKLLQLRAHEVISDREMKRMQIAEPAKPATPAQMQEGQAGMKYLERFITTDPDLIAVKEKVLKLAPIHHPVMILGDSGTGKELIARALHGSRTGRFIGINCAAISENLIESELFGHVKGSFTGAYSDKPGLFAYAVNGTAFLDEIGDLPYGLQAKLLRAIQTKHIRRVGSVEDEEINCRIVCATHKDIQVKLNETFRLDLYYRLSTFVLKLKPLCERPFADLVALAKHFGGDETDAEVFYNNRTRMLGNIRQIEQYFARKKVFGTAEWE